MNRFYSRIALIFFALLFFLSIAARAQEVSVCPDGSFNPYNVLSTELSDCGPGSTLFITATTVSGVASGSEAPTVASPISNGILTIQVRDDEDNVCETILLNVFIAEPGFTTEAVPGGCNEMSFSADAESPGCTHTYNVSGTNYTGAEINAAFPNAGSYNVIHTVQCGGCSESVTQNVFVPGAQANLNFTSGGTLFFDGNFQQLVVCSGTGMYDLTMTDASVGVGAGASYSTVITLPDGSELTSNTMPAPYLLETDQAGTVTVTYTVTQGGCISTETYSFFFAANFGSTELDVPIVLGDVECADDDFTVTVCPSGCPANPPGTVYRVVLDCTGFVFETTEVPAVVNVPLIAASCNQQCGTNLCSCELLVTAARPCVAVASAAFCPFRIRPQPDAYFELDPPSPDNTYCSGEIITFEPEWEEEDCDPFNPTPSICEIDDADWEITPAAGWVNLSADLQSIPLDVRFDTPGEYTVCFEWENDCGISVWCETICVLNDALPDIDWLEDPVYCVGDQISPSANYDQPACAATFVNWQTSDPGVDIEAADTDTPLLTFNQTGFIEVTTEIDGLCEPFEENTLYTVCDVPEVTLSQTDVVLCVGQEFCLENLIQIAWNNCTGDVTWDIPGEPGSPFVNPLSGETCISRDAADSFTVTLEAANTCGSDAVNVNITVEESPACDLIAPPPFCPGSAVDIPLPSGAVNAVWYFSEDGINFSELTGGMPHSPGATTQYYAESDVNGCFCISDTVTAELIPEPAFDVIVSAATPCPGTTVMFTTAPLQGEVDWLADDGTFLAAADSFETAATAPATLTAELTYGQDGVSCSTQASAGFTPEVNPISIDCSALPALLCAGDAGIPLPDFFPGGGTVEITEAGVTILTDPAEIDPQALGTGDFMLLYTVTNYGSSGCTFSDSCSFTISPPQIPAVTPGVDSLCYGATVLFQETSGLSGTWSSNCPNAVDPVTGLFTPAAGPCTPDATTEISYTGDCIQDLTFSVFLIEVPDINLTASASNPCPGDEVIFSTNPAHDEVTWYDAAGAAIGSGAELTVAVAETFEIFAEAEFGSAATSCTSTASLTVNPEVNPIVSDCSFLPENFCVGNDPLPLPAATPPGGSFRLVDAGGVVTADPTEIDPSALGAGDYTLIYELTGWGDAACTFTHSCSFNVLTPQTPQISPQPDSICFNTSLSLSETTGLGGTWSADCPGSIGAASGLFDPGAGNCSPDAPVLISYSGNCILDTDFEIFVHAVPEITTDVPQTSVCTNACISLSVDVTGNYSTAQWNLSWPSGNAALENGADFCPEDWGITGDTTVDAVLEVTTATSPVCTVTQTLTLQTVGIPEEDFDLVSPQCIAGGLELPDCQNCDSYTISFEGEAGNSFDCTVPGGGCFAPDTGDYSATVVFDYGFCQSDPRDLLLTVADEPFLEILSQNYDSCAPTVIYELRYGGYGTNAVWETAGAVGTPNPVGDDVYTVAVNHNVPVQVDTLYTDVITVSNFCGTSSASAQVYHQALPDFTIDPDNAYFCSAQIFDLEVGFAQPLQLDSLVIAFTTGADSGETTLFDFPETGFPYSFEAVNDTVPVNFTVTSANACGTVTNTAVVYIMPRDVSADIDIFYESPLCPGDTLTPTFNSTGNVNAEARTVTTGHPDLKAVKLSGTWYLIPQEGLEDGIYTVTLTELGFCGIDVDTEQITVGPTLEVAFEAPDVCLGQSTRFVPVVGSEADLSWIFEPDAFSVATQPPPHRYELAGLYFPSLTATNPDFCDGYYTAPVEVFAPEQPDFGCDVGCTGFLNDCNIDFNDGVICISILNHPEIEAFEWRVRGRFVPEYGNSIRIAVEDLRACEDNSVEVRTVDRNGCRSSRFQNIAFNDGLIHIPNAFSPNADGRNDFWRPVILGEPHDYHIAVMDRWGRTVWETTDYQDVWRGEYKDGEHYTDAQLYTYILSWKPCNRGEDKMKVITGHVTVVR